ncbi:MAG: CoA transferase, partial [Brevundimonas sp.]
MGQGPLNGLRVVEFAGIGPAPFCATLLSDLGAEVLRIDRPHGGAAPHDVTARGRAGSLALDLKAEPDRATALRAIAAADVLIEGFRPG